MPRVGTRPSRPRVAQVAEWRSTAQGLFPPPLLPGEHASLQQRVRVRDWRGQPQELGPETRDLRRAQEESRLLHVGQAAPIVHQSTQMLGQEIPYPRVGCSG